MGGEWVNGRTSQVKRHRAKSKEQRSKEVMINVIANDK
jgi:hypothetical protein